MSCVELLCVGTELLLGNIVNTDAQFLSQKLSELGINVFFQTVVGDNPARLESAVKIAPFVSLFVLFSFIQFTIYVRSNHHHLIK